MKELLDSFWRAAAYCLHPRVIALSVLPLILITGLALGLGYFFWERAIDAVNATIASWETLSAFVNWLDGIGLAGLKSMLAPLAVVFISTPVIIVLALLVVAALMTPSILSLVAERRFPTLERRRGGSMVAGVLGALWATVLALFALLLSVPLWFIPPLVLVVPPLIWGWLAYRVMSYDVLADHASREERQELIRRHRGALFGMGVVTGYLGAAPSLVWASGAMFVLLAPVLVPLAVWIYTLVFAFASLWFAHYALAALQALRAERESVVPAAPASAGELPLVEVVAPSAPALPPAAP